MAQCIRQTSCRRTPNYQQAHREYSSRTIQVQDWCRSDSARARTETQEEEEEVSPRGRENSTATRRLSQRGYGTASGKLSRNFLFLIISLFVDLLPFISLFSIRKTRIALNPLCHHLSTTHPHPNVTRLWIVVRMWRTVCATHCPRIIDRAINSQRDWIVQSPPNIHSTWPNSIDVRFEPCPIVTADEHLRCQSMMSPIDWSGHW
jgi:hypothetical protein